MAGSRPYQMGPFGDDALEESAHRETSNSPTQAGAQEQPNTFVTPANSQVVTMDQLQAMLGRFHQTIVGA